MEESFIKMGLYMKENGKIICNMEMENLWVLMDCIKRDIGLKENYKEILYLTIDSNSVFIQKKEYQIYIYSKKRFYNIQIIEKKYF